MDIFLNIKPLVACLQLDPKFAGSNPAEDNGIFKDDKNA
jgi:hypothetical protein